MNTNIEISNINKHFYSFANDCEYIDNKQYKTKIVKLSFYSKNEANISDIIKSWPYYLNYYSIIEDYDYINISQLNEKYIDTHHITNDSEYLIFSYKKENFVVFNDFLFNLISPKLFIFHVIESFHYILKSLIQLNNNDICFFNLSPQNIVFNLDCGEKPILRNFQYSLQTLKLNDTYINNIINKLDDYTYKSLEVSLLMFNDK